MKKVIIPLEETPEEKEPLWSKRYQQVMNERIELIKPFNDYMGSLHLQGVSDDLRTAIDDYNKHYHIIRRY